MHRLGVKEALEDEVATTWPRQQHGLPNESKLHAQAGNFKLNSASES